MHLQVCIQTQTLELLDDTTVLASYPISTSKFGLGTEPGSYKTPLGQFRIAQKIGDGAPLEAVFRGRQFTGQIGCSLDEEDGILTRILWLTGIDENNANTFERMIYIHGTNREDLIGHPASHGCIRMRNADIVDLFNKVPEGTLVIINSTIEATSYAF